MQHINSQKEKMLNTKCYKQVGIFETSKNEKANYTTKVENPEDRVLYEEFCHELTGDEINFAEDMEQANIPLTLGKFRTRKQSIK